MAKGCMLHGAWGVALIGTDPLTGLGLEAFTTRRQPMPTVLVRRDADVVMAMCTDLHARPSIALARLAIAP